MKNIAKYLILALVIYIINKMFGALFAIVAFIIILAVILWNNRANIMTRMAINAYFVKGDAQKGAKLYEKAYKTGEMTPECKISYSSFCLRENNFEKGKRLLNEVINSRFSSSEDKLGAKHNMAVLMWREGDLAGAFELMRQVHIQIPSTNTYGTMGVLYLERAKQGVFEGALEFLQEAYDYNDADKTIADNLGEFYYILGEYKKAKEVYEKLLEKDFTTPVPYYNYGRVLKAAGDKDKAKEQLEKALGCRFTSVMTITKEDVLREMEGLK